MVQQPADFSSKMKTGNLGWQRARRVLKEWAIVAGLLAGLHALLFLGWAALNPTRSTPAVAIVGLALTYVAGLAVIILSFIRRVQRATWPPEFREAFERGAPAIALVLDIAPTGWRSQPGSATSFAARPVRREYQMRLRVLRPGAVDYEVVVAEYLTSAQAPAEGERIPIRVHPRLPEVVALDRPAMDGGR